MSGLCACIVRSRKRRFYVTILLPTAAWPAPYGTFLLGALTSMLSAGSMVKCLRTEFRRVGFGFFFIIIYYFLIALNHLLRVLSASSQGYPTDLFYTAHWSFRPNDSTLSLSFRRDTAQRPPFVHNSPLTASEKLLFWKCNPI